MDQGAGRFRSTCHRGWGHRWMGHLLKVSTPCSSHSSRWDSSVCGALRYFQLRAETLRLMKMASPALETMEEALLLLCVWRDLQLRDLTVCVCSFNVSREILGSPLFQHPDSTQNVFLQRLSPPFSAGLDWGLRRTWVGL